MASIFYWAYDKALLMWSIHVYLQEGRDIIQMNNLIEKLEKMRTGRSPFMNILKITNVTNSKRSRGKKSKSKEKKVNEGLVDKETTKGGGDTGDLLSKSQPSSEIERKFEKKSMVDLNAVQEAQNKDESIDNAFIGVLSNAEYTTIEITNHI